MSPDSYTPTKELDRRERVGESIAHALMLADTMLRVALDEYDRLPPNSPLCNAMSDFQARIEEAVAELHVAARKLEGGRYGFIDAQKNPGVAAMDDLGKLLMGEK